MGSILKLLLAGTEEGSSLFTWQHARRESDPERGKDQTTFLSRRVLWSQANWEIIVRAFNHVDKSLC